jgi:hypothetical protein
MTENTPKKPRRKRRTKAQIAADKAAETKVVETAPQPEAEAPKEPTIDDVIVEMFEESVLKPVVAKEEIAESAESTDCDTCEGESADVALAAAEAAVVEPPEPQEPYVELTGLAKIKARIEQRRLRRMQGGA